MDRALHEAGLHGRRASGLPVNRSTLKHRIRFFGASPHDPSVFIGAALAFALVAVTAASIPAFRTTIYQPESRR